MSQELKTYLVGGAVRDQLLGREIKDRDYVVVGATPEQMLENGFKPVGADFPVFLHPQTHEEYALARTERKSGQGYHGFVFKADPTVTLEDDLQRRDLTINAMAQDADGEIIDPYGGLEDLQNKVLRHVSDAFAEDPVRVLRVARFMARYAHLGFRVHTETIALMRQLVEAGEVDTLVAERVWQEIKAAINEKTPSAFIQTLRDCGALKVLLPEIDCLFGVPQTKRWHPEVDTGVHVMMAMDKAADMENIVAFAVLVHDLGKGITPQDILPSHHGHEEGGVPLVEAVCERLRVPRNYRRLAVLVCRWHLHAHTVVEIKAKTLEKVFAAMNAYRQPQQLEYFIQACQADATGRLGEEFEQYPQADYIRQAFAAADDIDIKPLLEAGFSGPQLGERIRRLRIKAIDHFKKQAAVEGV
ncbi:multifunctional CCA addition/repair protein [Marinicella sp. W31]|uniref:multifunctional CCA addition/repair protein n=1 Tax=Marinicella sp. W31 TaxID=3023713 RepID=UPI003756CF5F